MQIVTNKVVQYFVLFDRIRVILNQIFCISIKLSAIQLCIDDHIAIRIASIVNIYTVLELSQKSTCLSAVD